MSWGSVEVEPEVEKWFLGLSPGHRGTAAFYIDLLADQGVHLGEPYTRQLSGKVRERASTWTATRCASRTGSRPSDGSFS